MRSNKVPAFGFAALLVLLVLGVFELLLLRFETGSVYPAYSSLRADPLGSKAYFESLALQPGRTLERRYKTVRKGDYSNTAMFFLGCDKFVPELASSKARAETEAVAMSGGRLIIGFTPVSEEPPPPPPDMIDKLKGSKPPVVEKKESRIETWGVTVERARAKTAPEENEEYPVKTALYFGDLAPEWRVLRRLNGLPVMIERTLGKGTVLMVTDSFFISNEGLRKARDPELLAGLPGAYPNIVFDESHLGTIDSGSVMLLARRFHLQGLGAALLLLVGLFLWRNTTSFLPRPPAPDLASELASGRSSAAGMTYLLRRSIPTTQLLEACMAQWQRSLPMDSRTRRIRAGKAVEILRREIDLPAKQQNLVRAYREITRALMERG